MKLAWTHGQIALLSSDRRALPCLSVLFTVLLTFVLSTVGFQMYASWKLGMRVRFNIRLIASVFLPAAAVPQPESAPVVQHAPFTDRPILLYGDSHLQFFSAWQPITTHPVLVWKPACQVPAPAEIVDKARGTDVVILHLGHGDIMRDKSDKQILDAYKAILNCLRDKLVVVLLPVPVNEQIFMQSFLSHEAHMTRRLNGLRSTIEQLCTAYPNVSTIDITARVVDSTGEVRPNLLVDYYHFTADVYGMWWEEIREKLSARTGSASE
jgi:hypothetical protein